MPPGTHLKTAFKVNHFFTKLGEHFEQNEIPRHYIFFSIDEVNLYGSILIVEAIDAACETLREHAEEKTFGVSMDDVRTFRALFAKERVLVQQRVLSPDAGQWGTHALHR